MRNVSRSKRRCAWFPLAWSADCTKCAPTPSRRLALASSVPKRIWKMCIFLISLTRKAFLRTEYVLDIFLVRAQIAFSQHFHLHLFRDSLFHDVFFRLGGGLRPHWRR